MSDDLHLYFPQQEFPYQEWNDLLALFHAVPHQDEFRKSPLTEWVIGVESQRGERVWQSLVWKTYA